MTLSEARVAAFYSFAKERESIRLRRAQGLPRAQWTSDPILAQYRFTNVKREHDRTTITLRQIYKDQLDACPWQGDVQNQRDLLVSASVFRFFGTEQSAQVLGAYSWARVDGRYGDEYFDYIKSYGAQGDLTFTSAYMVRGEIGMPKHESVVNYVRAIMEQADQVMYALIQRKSWRQATEVLTSCHGVGSFMAKEILLDVIMMIGVPDDWGTWSPVGPGGIRGASRVKHGCVMKMSEAEALEVIREIYAQREQHWPKTLKIQQYGDNVYYRCSGCVGGRSADCDCPEKWKSADVVSLDLTDCQWIACEYDKYSRVAEGSRPKRLFRPHDG